MTEHRVTLGIPQENGISPMEIIVVPKDQIGLGRSYCGHCEETDTCSCNCFLCIASKNGIHGQIIIVGDNTKTVWNTQH